MLHPVIHVQPFSTYFIQLELAVYLAVCAFFFRAYVVLDKVTYELYAYVGKYEPTTSTTDTSATSEKTRF